MSITGGAFGITPASAARFSTRGRIQGGGAGINYPNPFFDIAHTYLPVTFKHLFRWCRYYFLTNPLINATVFKMSEYPITDIIIEHEDTKVVKRWTEYYQDHLRYRAFQIESNLDYNVYGNGFISLTYPFIKYLRCRGCSFQEQAKKIRERWVFTNFNFRLNCPRCGTVAEALVQDFYYKNANGIKLLRWNCENIEVTHNEITGDHTYFYNIPNTIRNDVLIGKKDIVETTPQPFIEAMQQQKGIVFNKANFFHLKRPTLAQQDRGWGTPLILPVLKDTFYLQLMKKAQEALLLEHAIPLRILFPQAGSGSSDPYTTINLSDWKEHVAAEIARWRMDPNYIPILPLPVGHQTMGGDARALMLTQEIQVWSDQILAGMGVPRELVFGGISYAGSNVSLRMLENMFLGVITRHKQMAHWVMKSVAAYMSWPEVGIRFKPFKMADDIQRKAYLFQLNQAGKLSDTTLLSDADLNQEDEDDIRTRELTNRLESTRKEQLAMAQIQADTQVIAIKAQAKAQQVMTEAQMSGAAPGEPGGPEGTAMEQMSSPLQIGQQQQQQQQQGPAEEQQGMDIHQLAQMLATQYSQLDPHQQELAIQNLQAQSPELAQLVQSYAKQSQSEQPAAAGVDMRALPDQKPPRREASPI